MMSLSGLEWYLRSSRSSIQKNRISRRSSRVSSWLPPMDMKFSQRACRTLRTRLKNSCLKKASSKQLTKGASRAGGLALANFHAATSFLRDGFTLLRTFPKHFQSPIPSATPSHCPTYVSTVSPLPHPVRITNQLVVDIRYIPCYPVV